MTALLLRKLTFFSIVLAIAPVVSRAANITFAGNFTTDDAVQRFDFTVASAGSVDIRSYGYAGGTTSTRTVVPSGGFDSVLTLFAASGVFIDENDDGGGVAVDPATGLAGDARITANLTAGNYILTLTQYDNFSIGNLADGFVENGNPNFTADPNFAPGGACPGNMFRDISGTDGRCRNGQWTVGFSNVAGVAAVPEPSALLFTGLGLAALMLVCRLRHRRKATVLAGALAACASIPVHAQTGNCPAVPSAPDYCHVSDFLNGERNLLSITDVQVVRISSYSDNNSTATNSVRFNTSNSTIPSHPDTPPNLTADSSRAIRTLSARMFNQPGAATLTAMNDLQGSNSLGVWLSNVASLPSNAGAWLPTTNGDNPGVLDGAVADFNHDGFDDLVLSLDYGGGNGGLWVLTPNDVNDASKGPRRSALPISTAVAVAAGDFKGDGQHEIAGLTILAAGGLQLVIYTVDPQTLQITLAKSLVLTTPGVSPSAPITKASMARGRFNSAGHDQIAIGFATDSGFTYVEIIDFTLGTLTPFEASPAPLYTPDSSAFGIGYIQIKTGKFALPESTYDSIVYHLSAESAGGRFFEILKVDPTTLAVAGTSPLAYDEFACSFGLDVGNFDHRQQDPLNPNQTQPDPNDQIAFTYCVGSARPDNPNWSNTEGVAMNLYSVDPNSLSVLPSPSVILDLRPSIWAFGLNGVTTQISVTATDIQGRSLTLGEPVKISINNTIQPSAVVGVPPMHVDFVDPGDGNGPRVFNLSVVPDGFKSTYNQENSSSYASSSTNTTSWSFGAKETASTGFTIGDPDADFLKVSDTFTAAQNLKGSHEKDHGTYNGKSYNISATTGFGDEVSYTDSQFNIWVYPVIGQTVCPAGKPNCQAAEKVPLTLQFSAPDGNSQQPEAVQGQALQWYQPPWEPGNVFSYPANLDQLKVHYPDLSQLTNDTTGFLTDGSTLTQTATWTGTGENSNSTGLEQNYSFENDFSVNGAVEFAGVAAEGGYGLDLSGSVGFSSLIKGTTTLGKSTGLQISKPGTFPAFQNYGYSVKPYIMGSMQPGGVVDNQPLSADIQTVGVLRAVFTADPLSQDPPAGGWWKQAYTTTPDVALNHPSRWTYSTTSQPSSGNPPTNCLLTGDGKSMDCAELNQRSPNNPWLDIFHFMRGFFISSGVSPGQGPQLEQARAGDVLTLQTRVYNYSLAPMPTNTEVHARFYFMPWNTTNNFPAEPHANSYLISEEKVSAILPFNESYGPNAQPNWALVSTTFDTSKFAETKNGNANLVFWVLVWMQDANGTLIEEMPGHGLTAIPAAGTPNANGETTVSFSGPVATPGVAQNEECQTDGNCYSNNIGLYKQVFYIAPNSLGSTPGPAQGRVNVGKVEITESAGSSRNNKIVSAMISAADAAVTGVSVNFYDGDPREGGKLFAVERIPHIDADGRHLVQTPYQATSCGVHELFAVVNRGRASEIIRRAPPVRVACKRGPEE